MPPSTFCIPTINKIGRGCLVDVVNLMKDYGYQHVLIVTDPFLMNSGLVEKVTRVFLHNKIKSHLFTDAKLVSSLEIVKQSLSCYEQQQIDCIVSIGEGAAYDYAKAMIYLQSHQSIFISNNIKKPWPLITINTTSASNIDNFNPLLDQTKNELINLAIAGTRITPLLSVTEPELMLGLSSEFIAALGMNCLTYAIEAYVSTAANPVTDACALSAVKILSNALRRAVNYSLDLQAHENIAYAQFLAGMAFNNASQGYVQTLAWQVSHFYNQPLTICNAVLLPQVQAFNLKSVAKKLKNIAGAMGIRVAHMTDQRGAEACIAEIRRLNCDLGLPSGLRRLNVQDSDLAKLAKTALKSASGITNPVQANLTDLIAIYQSAM